MESPLDGGVLTVSAKHDGADAVIEVENTGVGVKRKIRCTFLSLY